MCVKVYVVCRCMVDGAGHTSSLEYVCVIVCLASTSMFNVDNCM